MTASEIQKLTPQLLSAAEMAAKQGEGSATMEHLNLLSQEWATKVQRKEEMRGREKGGGRGRRKERGKR